MHKQTIERVDERVTQAKENMRQAAHELNMATDDMFRRACHNALSFTPEPRTAEQKLLINANIGQIALAARASENEFDSFCEDTETLISFAVLVDRVSKNAATAEACFNELATVCRPNADANA